MNPAISIKKRETRDKKYTKMKVVIADNSSRLRIRIKDMITTIDDVEVVGEAENGLQALQLVEEKLPDFLVMDIRMPELNGISVLSKIKERGFDCKVCMITSYPYRQYKEKCMEEKADYFIDKNQDLYSVVNIVKELAKISTVGAYLVNILLTIVLLAGFTSSVMAQATVNSTAGVKILTPLSISETYPMHFGTIGVSEEAGGTVVISTAGVRSATGGVTLSGLAPLYSLATFTVTGEPLYTYAITLPETITITNTDNIATMEIEKLLAKSTSGTESNTATGTLMAGDGMESFTIGGTLTVPAGQLAGVYSGTFDVTVAYN
jgi:DNA-binding NarL/FixJ family response regulator